MDPSSEIHLIKTVEKQLISEHLNNILTKGLDALLEEDRKPELKLMYSLVGKFGSNVIFKNKCILDLGLLILPKFIL